MAAKDPAAGIHTATAFSKDSREMKTVKYLNRINVIYGLCQNLHRPMFHLKISPTFFKGDETEYVWSEYVCLAESGCNQSILFPPSTKMLWEKLILKF